MPDGKRSPASSKRSASSSVRRTPLAKRVQPRAGTPASKRRAGTPKPMLKKAVSQATPLGTKPPLQMKPPLGSTPLGSGKKNGGATPGFSAAMAPPSKSGKRNAPAADGAPRLVSVPDRGTPDEPLRVMYYASHGKARGLVVLAPGSRGGMGPGQEHVGPRATIGQFNPRIRCIYPDVARALSNAGYAVVHLTWRLNPTRKGAPPGTLKSPTQLMLGVADIALAARYARAQQGKRGAALPLAVVGFSFGGPSSMAAGAVAVAADGGAAAAAAGATGLTPLAGVVTIGCGMRVDHRGSAAFKAIGNRLVGGASRARPHDYGGVDSESCVDAYAVAGLPLCMIHGLADVTVDPDASAAIFARASGPKAALWLEGADHHGRSRADVITATLVEWLPQLLQRPLGRGAGGEGSALGSAGGGALGGALGGGVAEGTHADADGAPPPSGEAPSVEAAADAAGRREDEGALSDEEEGSAGDGQTGSATASDADADADADAGAAGADSSRAPSELDELDCEIEELNCEVNDPPSALSTYRGDASGGESAGGMRVLSISDAGFVPPQLATFDVRPDERCPFLTGTAITL